MKNMKYGLLFGLAAIGIMLLASCQSVFDQSADSPKAKPGYALVKITTAGGGNGRTVLPPVDPFTAYEYIFTDDEGNPLEDGVVADKGDGVFEIAFDEDGTNKYTVAVNAYIGDLEDATDEDGEIDFTLLTLAAAGEADFEVEDGYSTIVDVFLSPVTSLDQGKFTYTISYPKGAVAELTLTAWPGATDIPLSDEETDDDDITTITETLDLDAGSYLFVINVFDGDKYAGLVEAVHVFPYLETVYEKDFSVEGVMAFYEKFTVTFDKNGGDTEADPQTMLGRDPGLGSLPVPPTRAGYDFTGWNTVADGSGDEFTATTSVTEDIDVYAQWKSFTVTFNKNGGDTEADPQTKPGASLGVGTLPAAPTRTAYTFTGWNTVADGSGDEFTATTSVTEAVTVYAQWAPFFTLSVGDVALSWTNRGASHTTAIDFSTPIPTQLGYIVLTPEQAKNAAVSVTPSSGTVKVIKATMANAAGTTIPLGDFSSAGATIAAGDFTGKDYLQVQYTPEGGTPVYYTIYIRKALYIPYVAPGTITVTDTTGNTAVIAEEAAWATAPEMVIDRVYMPDSANLSNTEFDQENPNTHPRVKVLWSEDGLYVLAKVKDSSPATTNSAEYYRDNLEFFISEDFDFTGGNWNTAGGQYRVDRSGAKSADSTTRVSRMVNSDAAGYTIKAKIAFAANAATVATWGIEADKLLGIDAQIAFAREAGRDACVLWNSPFEGSYQQKGNAGLVYLTRTTGERGISFFWVDEHGQLATTSDKYTVKPNEELTISAADASYIVKEWRVDGAVQTGTASSFTFKSNALGKHNVTLVVEKDNKVYTTTIVITVER